MTLLTINFRPSTLDDQNRQFVKMREFADFPDSLGSPLHSVETFGILFSSVQCPPACLFAVFRRSQHKARSPMRISVAILAVLAFVAVPMATDAAIVTINATDFTEGDAITSPHATFKNGLDNSTVVASSFNAYLKNDEGISPGPLANGSYSGGLEFAYTNYPSSGGIVSPTPPPFASYWYNLDFGVAPLDPTLDEVLDAITGTNEDSVLKVDFTGFVKSVTVSFVVRPGTGGPEANPEDYKNEVDFGLYAFDSSGNFLAVDTKNNWTDMLGLDTTTITLTSPNGLFDIKTLLIGAEQQGSETVGILGLSFELEDDVPPPVVPEPASAALALFGLAGAYFGRRRLMAAA